MKLRALLSLLFIIATTFTAIHEIEHIAGEHNSASCQICLVDDNSVSHDIVDDFKEMRVFAFDAISSKSAQAYSHPKLTTNFPNAPPKNS